MRILYVFGFVVLWQNQFVSRLLAAFTFAKNSDMDLVKRGCKHTENTIQHLKTCLFRNYDNTIHPNYLKGVTNVTLKLMPKVMEFEDTILSLHSWILLTWKDPHLTWTSRNYDGITFIHVKSWEIWMPDVSVSNSGDMSGDQFQLPQMDCLLFNEGSISCVPAAKFMSKCNTDFTYWPYDKHHCRVTLSSWSYKGEEVDLHIDGEGINMGGFWKNTVWNFKFISSAKQIYFDECCPNATYPKINYNFLLTRYYDKQHIAFSIPIIVLILITLTVFVLDVKSVERLTLASVNLICHLLCMFYLHWQLPYNGTNTPNIMLFYQESLALAIFAVILTTLLRKLENMSTEMPNWISSSITLVLNNKAGRFLVLKDEDSKITDEDTATEENSDVAKSQVKMKRLSWKYFAVIIDWLSFFSVVLIYIIILLILVPAT
ncbi:neuronal acetylcholine receptor subunit alpha-3-like isoform X1 [Linepithema humile]|uniref:neuronal acetylcholine receptor subunit alpha-3-like isoform X1 n=1 Tax=Linepithema humile TaxID=83485 RepID=UPI00351EC35D